MHIAKRVQRKRRNALEKFHAFWKGLDDDERGKLWDIFSAIRGPDSESSGLKRQFSSRIRAELINRTELGNASHCAMIGTPFLDVELKKAINEIEAMDWKDNPHFLIHIHTALYVIRRIRREVVGVE